MPTNRDAPLLAREMLGSEYCLVTFRHPEIARDARAGQFVMIKAGTSAEPPVRRPFSIMSVDAVSASFSLLLKCVGPGSRALSTMPLGETAMCLGPLGQPFVPPPITTEALLIAGGFGIAPFVLFSSQIRSAGGRFRVFYGGRTTADLTLRAPFEEQRMPLVLTTEDGSLGRRGVVTEAVDDHLDRDPGPAVLYACGPHAMLEAVARIAAARRVPAQVSLDPWMGCGVGSCLGCVVQTQSEDDPRPKYRCACTEGPVFDAATVVWPGQVSSPARLRKEERT